MADNNGGFIGGLAGAVKGEQKEIVTLPMAQWEDVGRIRAQTINMAGLRVWQIAALLFCGLAWAYTLYAYQSVEVPQSDQLSKIITGSLICLSLVVFAVIVYDVWTQIEDSGIKWTVTIVFSVLCIGFIFIFTPVVTWSLLNMFSIGVAPIKQIVINGWIPIALSVVSLSIVPDFQIGRFAWWRELTNQPAASSEKSALDLTLIEIKRMELEHDEQKWERSNNTVLELEAARDEIQRLNMLVSQLQSLPPSKVFVPMNHGAARASYGSVVFSSVPKDGKISDQAALWKYVNEFEQRGTARDKWTGTEEQQRAQTHISAAIGHLSAHQAMATPLGLISFYSRRSQPYRRSWSSSIRSMMTRPTFARRLAKH